jgi:hypothetical protein
VCDGNCVPVQIAPERPNQLPTVNRRKIRAGNAPLSASTSTWCNRAGNRVWTAVRAAAFTRARLAGRVIRLFVRPCLNLSRLSCKVCECFGFFLCQFGVPSEARARSRFQSRDDEAYVAEVQTDGLARFHQKLECLASPLG